MLAFLYSPSRLVPSRWTDSRCGKRATVFALACILFGITTSSAHAGYVTTTFSNVNPGQVVTIHAGSTSESGWAGIYNFKNTTSDIGLSGNLRTFCIDIGQNIFSNQTVTFGVAELQNAPTPSAAMGPTRADYIRELWGRNFNAIGSDNAKAAAFQIAVWEIINETGLPPGTPFNINSGNFWVDGSGTSAARTQAQTWLSQLDGTGPKDMSLMAMTSNSYQDYVLQNLNPVPAPTTFALAGVSSALFLCFSGWRRFRQRLGASAPAC